MRLNYYLVIGTLLSIAALFTTTWLLLPHALFAIFFYSMYMQNRWGKFCRKIMWHLVMKDFYSHRIASLQNLFSYPLLIYVSFSGRADFIELGPTKFRDHVLDVVLVGIRDNMIKKTTKKESNIEYFDTELVKHRPDLVMEELSDFDKLISDPKNFDEEGNFITPK